MKTLTRFAAVGFVLFTTAFLSTAKADEWDKKTVITTHEPIQIQGKVLQPGQYIMKLLDTADRHVVQIYDADDSKLEMTIFAISAYRLTPTGDTRLTFSETPDGQTRALRAWFYPGDNSGLEFSAPR
jgi:hypothetical protein